MVDWFPMANVGPLRALTQPMQPWSRGKSTTWHVRVSRWRVGTWKMMCFLMCSETRMTWRFFALETNVCIYIYIIYAWILKGMLFLAFDLKVKYNRLWSLKSSFWPFISAMSQNHQVSQRIFKILYKWSLGSNIWMIFHHRRLLAHTWPREHLIFLQLGRSSSEGGSDRMD